MKHISRLVVVLALAAAACGGSGTTATSATTSDIDPRTPVILDYSPTVSDVGALLFLAQHPDLRLIAVTLPGTGESHCEPGVAHTRGALDALGLGGVPVACGRDAGSGPLNPFPPEWRERSDSIDLPEAAPNESRPAAELIADLVTASAVPVEIVAVGPLTNLADVLADPRVADRIGGITIMGGAVDVPGNVPPVTGWELANQYAEVNFWVDPTAAARVIASGVPITLVPLDATNDVPVDDVFYRALESTPTTPASALLASVWADAPEWVSDGYFLWDELAAAVLGDESLVEFVTLDLVVDEAGSSTAGWSREDPAGAPVRVAVSASRSSFESLFLEILFGRPVDLGRPEVTETQAAYFDSIAEASSSYESGLQSAFESAAAELGIGEETTDEEAWAQVITASAPAIVDGPMTQLALSLQAIDAPPEFSALHDAWVESLVRLLDNREAFLASLATFLADDAQTPPYLGEMQDACSALQSAGVDLGVPPSLGC